jgi:hypothetical protein
MCNSCYGYGFWSFGTIQPIGPIDASEGIPTIECPECHANANPSNTPEAKQRYQKIKTLYERSKKNNEPPARIFTPFP